jgi:hypothetical protein
MTDLTLPSDKRFGLFMGSVFIILSLYLWLIEDAHVFAILAVITSSFFYLLAVYKADALSKLNLYWAKLGLYLGTIISPIILFILYSIFIVPVGIWFKIIRRDILKIKPTKSTWVPSMNSRKLKTEYFRDQF